MPGSAYNVAHNGGKFWVIGTNVEGTGGYGIYKWVGNNWRKIPGSAIRVAADAYGRGWVVNKYAAIYGHINNSWKRAPGAAWDIDVGTNNKIWVIGTNREAGGYGIYRWDGHWTKIPGSALRIAVGGDGNAWVVNKYRSIYRYTGSGWVKTNGAALDICAHRGNVAVVGTNRRLYRRNHVTKNWYITSGSGFRNCAHGSGSRFAGIANGSQIWAGWA